MFSIDHEKDNKEIEVNNLPNLGNDAYETTKEYSEPVGETDDNLLFDFIVNKDKVKEEKEEEESGSEPNYSDSEEEERESESKGWFSSAPVYDHEKSRKEKAYALFQLKKLCEKGYNSSKDFSMEDDLSDIQDEVGRIKKEIEIERGIRLARQGLTLISSLIETGNSRFDPIGIDLDGWSESLHANIEDYDEVFEELYEKYHTSISMSPEIKLLLMVTGSAISFHITKKMLGSGMAASDIMTSVNSSLGGGNGGTMKGPSADNVAEVLAKMKMRKDSVSSVESEKPVKSKKGRKKTTSLDL